jgi:prepilin-type N-terminal cleavage/methylation domain-containing protein
MINMKKLNNKGFSLVELIIVIAIMAILIGVVGTQVIPYLENSRKAKDNQVFSSWNTAGMSAYTSCAGNLSGSENYFIKITGAGVVIDGTYDAESDAVSATTDDPDLRLNVVFKELTGLDDSKTIASYMSSKEGKKFDTNTAAENVIIYIPAAGSIFTTIGNDTSVWETIYNK